MLEIGINTELEIGTKEDNMAIPPKQDTFQQEKDQKVSDYTERHERGKHDILTECQRQALCS